MGRVVAEGIAESGLDIEEMLRWHLTGNHYPPLPTSMIEPCKAAIEAYNAGDYDRDIELPEGILYKGVSNMAPANEIIEFHHLESFLEHEPY